MVICPSRMTVAAKTCFAARARHRQAFARDGLLVDQRRALDDLAVDRNHAARIDHDDIAGCQLAGRNGDDHAVADDVRGLHLEFEQLADRAARAGRRHVADIVAELDQPRDDRAGHHIVLQHRGDHRERVEEIDIEAALAAPHPIGTQRDRVGVPQHQRQVDRRDDRIGAEGERDRQGRQHERHAPQQRLGAVDRTAALAVRRMLDVSLAGRDQRIEVVDRRQAQAADQGAQLRLLRGVVFDDDAGAVVVDPRSLDAGAGAQPGERGLGERAAARDRRDVKPHAARDEMPDRQFHRERPYLRSMTFSENRLPLFGVML